MTATTPAAPAIVNENGTNERVSIFSRSISGNVLTLTATAVAISQGAANATFDFAKVPGFSGLNAPSKVVFQRAVGQLLTQTYTAAAKASDSPASCASEMAEVFASLIAGTYTGRDSRLARLAAAIVAFRNKLSTRAEAEAHPKYAPALKALQDRQAVADKYLAAASAVAIPDALADGSNAEAISTAKLAIATAKKAGNAEIAILEAMAASPDVSAVLIRWNPPATKTKAADTKAKELLAGF